MISLINTEYPSNKKHWRRLKWAWCREYYLSCLTLLESPIFNESGTLLYVIFYKLWWQVLISTYLNMPVGVASRVRDLGPMCPRSSLIWSHPWWRHSRMSTHMDDIGHPILALKLDHVFSGWSSDRTVQYRRSPPLHTSVFPPLFASWWWFISSVSYLLFTKASANYFFFLKFQ